MICLLRAAALATGIAGSLVGPAFAVTLTVAQTPETIYAYPTAFGTLDPLVMGDCFEGLTAEDAHGEAIPGQAESWTISPDGRVYTFALRDGIAWSNGQPVTARDFVAAFHWLLDPVNAVEYAYLQFPILNAAAIASGTAEMDDLGIVALDERTLQITLERPTPFFLQTLTHSTAYPLPSGPLAEFGAAWLTPGNVLCNGPFNITEQVPGERTEAVKSTTYYGRDTVSIERVTYLTVNDMEAGLERFKRGEIDLFYDLPIRANSWIAANAAIQSQVVPFLGLYYYVANFDKPPFDNPDVRRALSMAIDRTVLDPQGVRSSKVPAYGLVPEGTANYALDAYHPDWFSWPYERRVAEAAAIMGALGFTPTAPLTLQIRYSSSRDDRHQDLARQVAEMWSAIGVKAELTSAEPTAHYEALRSGDFDIGRATWVLDFSDPSNILELFTKPSEFNVGGFDDPAYDALLARAATEGDLDARAQILRQAESMAIDSVAAIPLSWVVVQNLIGPGISGIVDNAKNVHRARWISVAR